MNERQIIERYFQPAATSCVLGIGDDAAVVADMGRFVVSTDSFVEGVHFFQGTSPQAVGWKALVIGLSDVLAMGATPRYALLALSIPHVDEHWLQAFSAGFFSCAHHYHVQLIGGDTVCGPLATTVTVLGTTEDRTLFLRSQVHCHDDIWITGSLGTPALAVLLRKKQLTLDEVWTEFCSQKLDYPTPSLSFVQEISTVVHAAIDVSDGLLPDLHRMLVASGGVGAQLFMSAMPAPWSCPVAPLVLQQAVLTGGDDYELLFCAPQHAREHITASAARCLCSVSCIGQIVAAPQPHVCVYQTDGTILPQPENGFDHFGAKNQRYP